MLTETSLQKIPQSATGRASTKRNGVSVSEKNVGLQIATKADGTPVISLSLVLERQPEKQDSIRPLVKSGVLTFDIALDTSISANTLYARNAVYAVHWPENEVIANSNSQGIEARTTVSVQLNQAQSLDALSLIDYRPSAFSVSVTVTYLHDEPPVNLTMKGAWLNISNFISDYCNDEGLISKSALRAVLPAMQSLNLVSICDENNKLINLPSAQFEKIFLRQAGVILKQTFEEGSSDIVYQLRPVTYAGFELNYTEKISRSSEKVLQSKATLNELLGKLPVRAITSECIILVAQQAPGSSQTVPVKAKISNSPVSRDVANSKQTRQLAVMNGKLSSVALAIRPVSNSTQFVRPVTATFNTAGLMNYVNIDLDTKTRPQSLPIVKDANAVLFSDRVVTTRAWYTPKFEVVMPEMNAGPGNSPFLFSYESVGATSSGKLALKANLRVTFKLVPSPETAAALAASGLAQALPVNMHWLSINLLIPFIDEADGLAKQHAFPAKITTENDLVTASVEFANDWARLAYGSLSTVNFQATPAVVQVFYVFSCYNIVQTKNYQVIFGAKTLNTKVLYATNLMARDTNTEALLSNVGGYINAESLTFEHPLSTLQFKREMPGANKTSKDAMAPANFIYARPLQSVVLPTLKPVAHLNASIWAALTPVQYSLGVQTVISTVPLLFPCNELGNFYQQIISGEPQSIGCQDAFKLGEIQYKEYEEIMELRDAQFQVYRALPQPGRFMIVPVRYCVTRREVGEEDAYRPLIFLNALLDPATPANNKVELRVTMQPDIPVYKINQINQKLKSYHPDPSVVYSVGVQNKSTNVAWAVDPTIAATSESDLSDASGPFISVYFSTDLPGWQLLKTVLTSPGLNGSIAVDLADGSQFSSNLLIKLDTVRGTWLKGPLDMLFGDGQVTITNKTKGKINISDMVRYEGDTIAETFAVGVTLDSESATTVTAPEGLVPVYSYALGGPVAIEETRSFVEDIYSNFIIINLVNFENHNLIQLEFEASVRGLDEVHRGTLTDTERVVDFDYILPLTSYLESFMLDIRVTKIFNDKPAELTPWIAWDLNNGPVSLTPDLLTL